MPRFRNRPGRAAVIGLAIVVAVGMAAFAFADTKTVKDPEGDTSASTSKFDLRSVNVAATKSKVTFTVVTWNAAIPKKAILVGLLMKAGGESYVGAWNGSEYGVFGGSNSKPLKVTRKSAKKVVMSFATSAIGSPGSLRWRVVAGQQCETCPVSDAVPDKGYVSQTVG